MGGYPVPKPSFNLAAVVAETIGLAVQDESVSVTDFSHNFFCQLFWKAVFFNLALKFLRTYLKFQ